jgi:hypothetical protein
MGYRSAVIAAITAAPLAGIGDQHGESAERPIRRGGRERASEPPCQATALGKRQAGRVRLAREALALGTAARRHLTSRRQGLDADVVRAVAVLGVQARVLAG